MIRLSATNLHYLGDTKSDKRRDYCLHGYVLFAINNDIIEDGGEWCTSASALRFMRSVLKNHFSGAENHMIPCCGNFIIPADDGQSVGIFGCQNGVDFDVIHEGNQVIIRTESGQRFAVNFSDYKAAVLAYAEQIEKYMNNCPSRIFDDPFHKSAYNAFMAEWTSLKEKILKTNRAEYAASVSDFSDYISVPENEISGISKNGISLKNGQFINFKECAYNYSKINGGTGKCIGERNSTNLSFTFYTDPFVTSVTFSKYTHVFRLFAGHSAHRHFTKLQNIICTYGYTIRETEQYPDV